MGLPKVTTFLSALVIANMVGEQVRFEMKRAPTFISQPRYPINLGKSGVAAAKRAVRKESKVMRLWKILNKVGETYHHLPPNIARTRFYRHKVPKSRQKPYSPRLFQAA